MKYLKITLEGKTYEVGVESLDAPAAIAAPATPFAQHAASASAGPEIKGLRVASPMAGIILNQRVKVGDKVSEGQELLVLEAMKMETSINAPKAGKILAILVEKGVSVSEGQALLILE